MPKIPDFSKFDLQSIVNSVKSIINPEATPKVAEGDPIGAKMVQISTLLQNVANAEAQSAKDLTQINNLLNELYQDLETFRRLEAEFRQKQQAAEAAQATSTTEAGVSPGVQTKASGRTTESTSTTGSQTTGQTSTIDKEKLKKVEENLKRKDQSPLHPNEGTSKPTDKD